MKEKIIVFCKNSPWKSYWIGLFICLLFFSIPLLILYMNRVDWINEYIQLSGTIFFIMIINAPILLIFSTKNLKQFESSNNSIIELKQISEEIKLLNKEQYNKIVDAKNEITLLNKLESDHKDVNQAQFENISSLIGDLVKKQFEQFDKINNELVGIQRLSQEQIKLNNELIKIQENNTIILISIGNLMKYQTRQVLNDKLQKYASELYKAKNVELPKIEAWQLLRTPKEKEQQIQNQQIKINNLNKIILELKSDIQNIESKSNFS